jgi:replicative DNA helicase
MKASSTAPDSAQTERRLISACMTGGPICVAGAVGIGVAVDAFIDPMLGALWQSLVACATEHKSTQAFLVARQTFGASLSETNLAIVTEISALEPTSIYAKTLALEVVNDSKRRKASAKLQQACGALAKTAERNWDDDWSLARAAIREAEQAASAHAITKGLAALCDEYIAEERNGKAAGKVGTGIAECDDYFGKLGAGEVLVMAGRPAVGKTALAIQMADSVVRAGGRAMIVSLEMNGKDLVGRIAKQRAGRGSAITRGCSKAEYDAAKEARIRSAEKLKDDAQRLNIFEVAETNSVSRIEDRVAMLASADELPDVVVIDYLQLIQPEDSRTAREQQVATMSRRLKLMALAFRVPVILLSQLNRDAEKNDRRPRLSDLRESGSIEQDADRVWLLYPDPEVPLVADSPTVQVVIDQAKNRNGAGGIAKAVRFFKPAFAFEKL